MVLVIGPKGENVIFLLLRINETLFLCKNQMTKNKMTKFDLGLNGPTGRAMIQGPQVKPTQKESEKENHFFVFTFAVHF